MVQRLTRDILHGYQNKAIDFLKVNPKCGLFMDMGLGKTVSTLTALTDLFNRFESSHVLIVAPLRVAFHTWPEEIEKWEHIDLDYTLIKGTPEQRWTKLTEPSRVKIINIDLIHWLVDYYCPKGSRKNWPFDMVVVDESSGLKDQKSRRFKFMRKICRHVERMVLLTGTPAPNGLLNLWPQLYLLDQGERLCRGIERFRSMYFKPGHENRGYTIIKGAEKHIYKKIEDICMTLDAKDYLELPKRIDNMVNVDMPKKAWEMYRELEKEFIFTMENDEGLDDNIVAVNAAVLVNKLLQVASGAIYFTKEEDPEEERHVKHVHNSKLDALAGIISEANSEPVLIAYNFKHERDAILKKFKQARVLDEEGNLIKDWNQKKIPILVVHPKSAGHGLNLQKGGHIAVWYSMNWSLELYQQFNARLHRQGQTKPVVIHHIMATGTADETVYEALQGKTLTQRDLLDALKREIENDG